MQTGKRSMTFSNPPRIIGASSVVGKKEAEGPLGQYFDVADDDDKFGGTSWEDSESRMQMEAAKLAIKKAGCKNTDIRYIIGGDLLGQLIATSFGIESLEIPLLGVYGACSTMGEAMLTGAILTDGGYADRVLAITSSHFASAEKQFRFPLGYGSQRTAASCWTVTGSGAVVIERSNKDTATEKENGRGGSSGAGNECVGKTGGGAEVVIKGACIGKIVDYGIKDSLNMGACMAPAAADTIAAYLDDTGAKPADYDQIITGDLGSVGTGIMHELLLQRGYKCSDNHMDCGLRIFSCEKQGVESGGSGCGCSAVTFTGYIIKKLKAREWKRVLFIPTGALLSPTSFNEGQSVPGIAHLVEIAAV